MDLFKDINTLIVFTFFFVPGFISMKIYDLFVPMNRGKLTDHLLEVVSYGCLNFAIFYFPFSYINQKTFIENHLFLYYLCTIFMFFVAPICWPIFIKWFMNLKVLKKYILHPYSKSWDYFFHKKESCWILVRLKNGKLIGGLYSGDSFASSFPAAEDLYIQEAWKVNKNGEFLKQTLDTKGIWICKDQIAYLEFYKCESQDNTQ